jgi:histidinol-phosphate/aromatic aminotransferase/cobyric acid decarboxylase-like protein
LQEAAAAGLEQAEERKFFETQRAEYAERRKVITDAFDALGLKYTLPEGSYFVLLVSVGMFGWDCECKLTGHDSRIFRKSSFLTIIHSLRVSWGAEEISGLCFHCGNGDLISILFIEPAGS